jgi:hypothetical protein
MIHRRPTLSVMAINRMTPRRVTLGAVSQNRMTCT